jgi:hypothetical protein
MLLRLYLALVGWAFVGGAVLQLLLTRYTGTRSVWGISPGWQREIGLWNVAMLVVVNRAVRSDIRVQRDVALARWRWSASPSCSGRTTCGLSSRTGSRRST